MSPNNKLEIDYEKLRQEYKIKGKITEAKQEGKSLVLKLEENDKGLYEMKIYNYFDKEDY